MDGKKTLSEIVIHNKYAKFIPELSRRETWEEIVDRNKEMHLNRFKEYPEIIEKIHEAYEDIYNKKIMPSMRSLQFAGRAIEKNESRIYNCSFLPINDVKAFSEVMFLLLGGTGVGYSVQNHDINQLNLVTLPNKDYDKKYLVMDSLEGWADAVHVLIDAYLGQEDNLPKSRPIFDFSDVREKGLRLITAGGKAPGSEPLKKCLEKIEEILINACSGETQRQLKSIEVHDIVCHIADAVLSGGIRRAALICLFSKGDEDMLNCKSGLWYNENPQRARANNSVNMLRSSTTKEEFDAIFERCKESFAGEPGFYFTNNELMGTNPCAEISLNPYQFCNLVDVSMDSITSNDELFRRVTNAAIVSTLQASYTDFHYLRIPWKLQTEAQALIGVGLTGIASCDYKKLDLKGAAELVVKTNLDISSKIGIKPAVRTTTVKPSGTTSIVLETSSGIHSWHDSAYIRRMRVMKNDPLYSYIKKTNPELLEDDFFDVKNGAVISIPVKAPSGAITREESALELLDRIKYLHENWIKPGHVFGTNTNNVSATVSVRDGEWDEVKEWMWENRESYNGISLLPFDGGSYVQAPFESISESTYKSLAKKVKSIDLSEIKEDDDNISLNQELACSGGSCEITSV